MSRQVKYETRPLDCWAKGKELLVQAFQNAWTTPGKNKRLGVSIGPGMGSFINGFPDCELIDLSYLFAAETATDSAQSIRFSDAAGARGYLGDICYPNLHLWGSMFLNEGFFRTEQPDFCFQMHVCESQGKGAQVLCEHLGTPYFCLDIPLVTPPSRRPFHDAYLSHQLEDAIVWLERTLGTRFDDEQFLAGVKNEWECRVLFGQVLALQQAVPAPLDLRALQSLSAPRLLLGHQAETVAFYRVLYDEVQDRVARGIASLATERCRLLHDGPPPYHSLQVFRQVERYGALFVGGSIELNTGGLEQTADGSWQVVPTLAEQGVTLATRADGLRLLVDAMLDSPSTCGFLVFPRVGEIVSKARDWHADGVVLHCDRGCQAFPASMPETRLALMECSIPTMIYESSCGDPRELNTAQLIGSIESFMEVLGLSPLPS